MTIEINKDKLILVKSPADDTWIANYNGEEAHNIDGKTHEERLDEAAKIWGVYVGGDFLDEDCVDYEIWG